MVCMCTQSERRKVDGHFGQEWLCDDDAMKILVMVANQIVYMVRI